MSVGLDPRGSVRQLTFDPHGHILTNSHVWSPDSQWIVYDVRSDAAGSVFDGDRIERVHVETGSVEVLYRSRFGACCGVATYAPSHDRVVFILGPENPTDAWKYSAFHRRGMMVDISDGLRARSLDAMNYAPPLTPGALRGGSHVHVFHSSGDWVSFTYEDHLLASLDPRNTEGDFNQRNVGVSWLGRPTHVAAHHPRNHSGESFSVVVTRTVNHPIPGSDEIQRAYEEAWLGSGGYPNGVADRIQSIPRLAFLGDCIDMHGSVLTELFVLDLPSDITLPDKEPLEGTETRRPSPPKGSVQRRLTRTDARRYPGIRGPRHWPRSSPDGKSIAILMLDDEGRSQLFLVDSLEGTIHQLTHLKNSVDSAFTWSPDGRKIALISDGSVMVVEIETGKETRVTTKRVPGPRPEACVFSPNGRHIAYVCPCGRANGEIWNQIFVVEVG